MILPTTVLLGALTYLFYTSKKELLLDDDAHLENSKENEDLYKDLDDLLEIIYRFSAKMNLFMHGEETMNMEDYIEPVIINDEVSNYVRATAQLIMGGMARYYWFNQHIKQWVRWEDAPPGEIEYPNLEKSNWSQFLEGEKKHMITRLIYIPILSYLLIIRISKKIYTLWIIR